MRLFSASIATETNTFSPIPTSFANFLSGGAWRPGELPEDPKLCCAPLQVARTRARQEGFTLIEGSCFWSEPSGSCAKPAFEIMRDEILEQLKAAMPVDGVLMGFHGAFVADGYDDAEGDMLERIRAIVGPKAVIGAEYDPHCHMTEKRIRLADISICFKEYPHVDFYERGEELVELVLRKLRGRINPVVSLYDCRMWDFYPTTTEPMRSFVDRIKGMEGRDGVLSISIAHGFSHADVADMGTRVLVITDGDKAKGERIARELGRELYERRGTWTAPTLDLDDMLDEALATDTSKGPVVIAEPSDNAGGGAGSDNTDSIHRLRARGIRNAAVGPVWDPQAVDFCFAMGEGGCGRLRFGGKSSADAGLPVDAAVEIVGLSEASLQSFGPAKTPLGRSAGIRFDGIEVSLVSHRSQALGLELFTNVGIDPAAKALVMVKSAQHFAGNFGPIASKILRAETGGCCPQDPRKHAYTKITRPFWPLDEGTAEGIMLI
jgi:microcystin degradation protein MlrC